MSSEYKVLVTGASRGIGKAISELYRSDGYRVYTPSRDEMDLGTIESVKKFISENKDGFDIIINNAGINEINILGELEQDNIDDMININLVSPMLLIDGFIGGMKKNGFGRIVNIASIWSVTSKGGRGVYSATKRGIHGITTTAAVEYGQYGVLTNTVSPGFTLTDLTRKNNSEEAIKAISETIPVKRMAEVDEIAKVVCYLGSDKNTYINGQNIVVDGGFSL